MSSELEARHHLLIAGTGRAGTTLLVRLLDACGLETHIAGVTDATALLDPAANAGLENDPLLEEKPPYVVKRPFSFQSIDELMARADIKIDGVIIPVRDLSEATASRVILELSAEYTRKAHLALEPKTPRITAITDGGAFFSLEPLDQARLLSMEFHQLIEALLEHEIPIHFLKFPKFTTDPDYLYRCLRPVLPNGITLERFKQKIDGIIEVGKVRVADEIEQFRGAVSTSTGVGQDKQSGEFDVLDNVAAKRALQAANKTIEQYKHAYEESQKAYGATQVGLTQTQTALTQTQTALQQTQEALQQTQKALSHAQYALQQAQAELEQARTHSTGIEEDNALRKAQLSEAHRKTDLLEAELHRLSDPFVGISTGFRNLSSAVLYRLGHRGHTQPGAAPIQDAMKQPLPATSKQWPRDARASVVAPAKPPAEKMLAAQSEESSAQPAGAPPSETPPPETHVEVATATRKPAEWIAGQMEAGGAQPAEPAGTGHSETAPPEQHIEVDRTTELPDKSVEDLIATKAPGQALPVPEIYVEVKAHELSVASTNPVERMSYADHTYRAPEMTLERLLDHYWFPEHGFLLSKEGKVWRHSLLGQFGDPNFLTTYAVQDRHNDEGTTDYIFHEHLLHAAPVVEDLHLITSHYASHNFGHFMLDMVPLIQQGAKHELKMLSRPMLDWQKPIYRRIGVDPGEVTIFSDRAVFLKDVLVSIRHNAVSTYAASPHHREVFDEILQTIRRDAAPAKSTARLLFVSRGVSKNRDLRNRAQLGDALDKIGFETFRPETFSFDEQALRFSQADVIVTEFGAIMTNVLFCRPGTKIIEIIPEDQKDPWSAHLCAALGLEHVTLFHVVKEQDRETIEIGGITHRNIFFKFDADVARVVSVVKQLQR